MRIVFVCILSVFLSFGAIAQSKQESLTITIKLNYETFACLNGVNTLKLRQMLRDSDPLFGPTYLDASRLKICRFVATDPRKDEVVELLTTMPSSGLAIINLEDVDGRHRLYYIELAAIPTEYQEWPDKKGRNEK